MKKEHTILIATALISASGGAQFSMYQLEQANKAAKGCLPKAYERQLECFEKTPIEQQGEKCRRQWRLDQRACELRIE